MSGQLKGDEKIDELRQIIGKMRQDIEWLMQGRLSSKNIREVGGYNVNQTDLVSKDGDVGLSSANDAVDPVRIFAGGTNKNTAPWRVTKAGKMHATGATIESQSGYPKVVLEPEENLIGAFSNPISFLQIIPDYSGNPVLYQEIGGVPQWLIAPVVNGMSIQSFDDLYLAVSGNIIFNNSGFQVQVQNWGSVYGLGNLQTLQQALDNKLSKTAINGTVYVASTPGGSPTTPITFTNGVRTS